MLALRAYLAVVASDGSLAIEVHRELGSITDSWKTWQLAGAKALIDVGFSRLADSEILRILDGHDSRVILSRPARDIFARVGSCSARPVDRSLEGVPYYLAISGWGYEIEDPSPKTAERQLATGASSKDELGEIAGSDTDSARFALPLGGSARDLVILAAMVPSWAFELPIDSEQLAIPSARQLRRNGIHSFSELSRADPRFIYGIRWMGPARISSACDATRSLISLDRARTGSEVSREVINPSISQGTDPLPFSSDSPNSLIMDFDRWIDDLSERDQEVLIARTGRAGPPPTLDAIAEAVGVTRERVRQITNRRLESWVQQFDGAHPWTGVVEWLETSEGAPWLERAAQEVAWLEGVGQLPDFVRTMLDCFEVKEINVVEIGSHTAIAKFSQQDWRQESIVFRRLVRAAVDEGMPLDLLRAALVGAASGFAGHDPGWIADVLLSEIVVARPRNSPPVVVGLSAVGESIVRKILVEADQPLHFTEIHRRAIEQGFDLELRRAHSAATTVGYLFDRGTYGTLEHTGLAADERDEYRRTLEVLILEAEPDKQWHSQDLYALMETPVGNLAGEYLVDIVLEDSNGVVDLGRRVWASGLGSHRSTADRIDQQQAVESLLLAAGAPMTSKAIQAELRAHRGVGKNFQIHEAGKLVRTGVSQWGLLDRDVPLSVEQVEDYLDRLRDRLSATSQGVHKTELVGLVSGLTTPVSPELLMSVATRTGEFRATQSDFVILPDWESHYRPTVPEAVATMLAQRPASTAELLDYARETVGLEIPMYSVHAALKHLGAEFDQSSNTWAVPQAH